MHANLIINTYPILNTTAYVLIMQQCAFKNPHTKNKKHANQKHFFTKQKNRQTIVTSHSSLQNMHTLFHGIMIIKNIVLKTKQKTIMQKNIKSGLIGY